MIKKIMLICLLCYGLHDTIFSIILTPPNAYPFKEVKDLNIRHSSFPYISGDTFRHVAQFHIDEFKKPLNPDEIKDGDIIFVRTYWLKFFFEKVRPHIKSHYILITHNSISSSPGKFAHMLDDENLITWFAQNVDISYDHPKLIPIPVGIANAQWPHGNTKILDTLIQKLSSIEKNKLIYVNFNVKTSKQERSEAEKYFAHKSFCYKAKERKKWPEYLVDLAQSQFVVSPRGNGLDCHRTWEVLLMGSIPVVKTSSLDPLYKDLPVVIVKEWHEVTEEFLYKTWQHMQHQSYNKEKMYAGWWIDQIKACQEKFLKNSVGH